jgi:penicillin V acylase-like amidase (Ntn superfamily)
MGGRSALTSVKIVLAIVFLAASGVTFTRPGAACSRIFWNDNGVEMISARTFDWERHFRDVLWIMPKGIRRAGRAGANSASWTSKYGSVVLVAANGTSEGLNEASLAVHLLYLDIGVYEARDSRPGVGTTSWVQYLLDNCRTVDEALAHSPLHSDC